MGLMDNLKARLAPAKGKVADLAQHHGGKVQHGIVDERTKGKYHEKIHTGTDKAKGAMDRLAHKDEPRAGGDTFTPPTTPPPGS